MAQVLIVSSSAQGRGFLEALLQDHGHYQAACAQTGGEARRMLIDVDYDLVLINAPLKDEFGGELALKVAQQSAAGVLLIVKGALADEVSARVEDFGVFVLPKPISRALFFQAVKLAQAAHLRMMGLRSENEQLQVKIAEIRLIDRAKCVLIQYQNMTEQQAHRYIEKQAMDLRVTRREVAQGILQAYEQ